jgi:hypothetical protein
MEARTILARHEERYERYYGQADHEHACSVRTRGKSQRRQTCQNCTRPNDSDPDRERADGAQCEAAFVQPADEHVPDERESC